MSRRTPNASLLSALLLVACAGTVGSSGSLEGDVDTPSPHGDANAENGETQTDGDHSALPHSVDIFDDSVIRDYYLVFDQPDWAEQLRQNARVDATYAPEDDVHTYIPAASFTHGETVVHNVGVRYRGRSTHNWDYPDGSAKPSFRIKFNKYVSGQRFMGFKKINFRNNNYDPSWLKEKIVFDILEQYTVSVRTAHARLFVNGEDFGLYLLLENIDRDYIKSRFGITENGDLFKCEEFGIEMRTGEPIENYIRKTNEKEITPPGGIYDYHNDPKTALVNALALLNKADVTQAELEAAFDLSAFIRFLVINNFFVNVDSYMGRGHNYYLYQRDSDGRFIHLAWDMNTTFSGMVNPGIVLAWNPFDRIFGWWVGPNGTQEADQMSPFWPLDGEIKGIKVAPYMPYSQKILQQPALMTEYRNFYGQFLREEFGPDGRWDDRIDTLKTRISASINADTHNLYPKDVSLRAMEDFLPGGYDAIGPDGPSREGIRQWGWTRFSYIVDNYPEIAVTK